MSKLPGPSPEPDQSFLQTSGKFPKRRTRVFFPTLRHTCTKPTKRSTELLYATTLIVCFMLGEFNIRESHHVAYRALAGKEWRFRRRSDERRIMIRMVCMRPIILARPLGVRAAGDRSLLPGRKLVFSVWADGPRGQVARVTSSAPTHTSTPDQWLIRVGLFWVIGVPLLALFYSRRPFPSFRFFKVAFTGSQ